MRDDERVFSFGFQFFIIALIAVALFHAAFSADEKKLAQKNKSIMSLEQDLANARVRFATLVQPEILRPIVMQLYPDYRPIGTGRFISARNME
ncbi:MAG: hypothetical protein LBT45_01625 [Rickettsiales bacterium]|jgi:hypothetical protein|nr:hypothetical protein [Rickettsiales bacterium]